MPRRHFLNSGGSRLWSRDFPLGLSRVQTCQSPRKASLGMWKFATQHVEDEVKGFPGSSSFKIIIRQKSLTYTWLGLAFFVTRSSILSSAYQSWLSIMVYHSTKAEPDRCIMKKKVNIQKRKLKRKLTKTKKKLFPKKKKKKKKKTPPPKNKNFLFFILLYFFLFLLLL